MTATQQYLESIGACTEAREWVGNKSLKEAWATCPRADWMLWLLARRSPLSPVQAVKIAIDCARLVLVHVPAGEDRPRLAIEAAERWLADPTETNRTAVRDAAAYAAYADAAADAARAARAAYYAARAAYYAARAAADAAYYAATDVAYYAAWAAARTAAYAAAADAAAADACADIVRKHVPCPVRRPAQCID